MGFWALAIVRDLGPGSLDSRRMFLPSWSCPSACDCRGTPAEGELQYGCSKTHKHSPWGCCSLRCNPKLRPIPAICQRPSTVTQPWLFHLQLRSALYPAAKAALPPGPRPTSWVFTGSHHATHYSPCNTPCSFFPSSALALKVAPGTRFNIYVAEKPWSLLLPPPAQCQGQTPSPWKTAWPHLRSWCCPPTGHRSCSQNKRGAALWPLDRKLSLHQKKLTKQMPGLLILACTHTQASLLSKPTLLPFWELKLGR